MKIDFRHLDHVGVKLDFYAWNTCMSMMSILVELMRVLKKYKVDKFYLKRYSDDQLPLNGACGIIFNYNNALNTARKYGVILFKISQILIVISELGDMDIQLYNYKNEYGPDGRVRKYMMTIPILLLL